MKKISIIGLSMLLAACSSGNYTTDVTSESYTEEYQTQMVAEPVLQEESVEQVASVKTVEQPVAVETVVVNKTPQPATTYTQSKKVKIIPPEQKHKDMVQRFGYTLQVVAVGSPEKAQSFANQLPAGHPVWMHYKQVNGTNWYALLYGDYKTKSEARAAIRTLPGFFKNVKPFVKSLDDIKNSEYPKITQLR